MSNRHSRAIFRSAYWLTLTLIAGQILLAVIHAHLTGMDAAFLKNNTAGSFSSFFSAQQFYLIYPAVKYLLLQVLIYAVYGFVLGYITLAISASRPFLFVVWLISVVLLLSGNLYFVPHSLFSIYLPAVNHAWLYWIFNASLASITGLLLFALIKTQHSVRWLTASALMLAAYIISTSMPAKTVISHASTDKPNVILIGFDALRPDFLTHFNASRRATPHFDDFLQHATVFTNVYTPDARTFPTWVSILTGRYPLHHKARDDNADLSGLNLQTTLAQAFQQDGYETIFASDDNRFNNINHTEFGFNRMIGPTGNAIDMMLSNANDNLLSNLIVQTALGKWLFADYIGNHGAPQLYQPDDFLQTLKQGLQARDSRKPVFMAAHFNVTAWPFFFRDGEAAANDDLVLYERTIQAADHQLAELMQILQQNNLLDHTIFVLFSDHGITLNLPQDRLIQMDKYRGDKNKSWIKHNKAGVETSWGYGNDLLSLKQNQPLLAVRFFGLPQQHLATTNQRVLLIDITPTVLKLAGAPPLPSIDGMNIPDIQSRPIFFETSYSLPEIESGNIDASKVLLKTMANFDIDEHNALLKLKTQAAQLAIQHKQRAVLSGDWLLVYYPAESDEEQQKPAYNVLLNMKTGAWTTNLQRPLAAMAPVALLKQQLHKFYGKEMEAYQ